MLIFDTETNSLDMFAKDIVLLCYSNGDETVHTCENDNDVYALKTRLESDELKVKFYAQMERY